MFTLYDDKLAWAARAVVRRQARFVAGCWADEDLAAHQVQEFRNTLRYVQKNSPFYHEHLAGVRPEAVADLSPDSLAGLPFTTKDDLRRAQHRILSKPLKDAWICYETTGTTGPVTPCPRDNTDSLHNNAALTAYYGTVFERHGEQQVVGVSGPTEMHAFADTFGDVCRNLGLAVAKMWPHSPMVGFDRALQLVQELPLTALFCTPRHGAHPGQEGRGGRAGPGAPAGAGADAHR